MTSIVLSATPLLAHVAGLPVEEVLLGVLACGAAGIRVATVYLRRRPSWPGLRGAPRRRDSLGRAR